MTWITATAEVATLILFIALLAAAITLWIEKEKRAFRVALLIGIPVIAAYLILCLTTFEGRQWVVYAATAIPALLLLILLTPSRQTYGLKITGAQSRVDERDALFHRFYRIQPGSKEFSEFYQAHPEKQEFDDNVRELPPLACPGAKTYDKLTSPFQVAAFSIIEDISRNLEWTPAQGGGVPVEASPAEFTKRVKGFAKYLGAVKVGCTVLNPAYLYSHIGRSPGEWGAKIELNHKYAVAIAVEMSNEMVRHSPGSPTTTETAFKYLEVGKVAMVLARYINLLGYEARAHVDGNYRVMCVPVAVDAGLGELGRLGLLMTPEFGPRIRLSVVTTDLPLLQDKPIDFGVQDFCSFCKKCAHVCPSSSIDKGEKRSHNGVEKWQSVQDTCYRYWRMAGSDCALCVKVCPYSHPNNLMHNALRYMINRNHIARRLALKGDDLLYGRRPKDSYPLPDWHE